MSEALIMPGSIGSIIGSILATAFNLGVLIRDITNAPVHIQKVCAEAESCRKMVITIRTLLYQIETDDMNKDVKELIYVASLAKALAGCQEALGLLEQEVEGLVKENMKIGKDERAPWVWREEEIAKHLKFLELHKMTLTVTLNVLNTHQGRELRKQNARILKSPTTMAGSNNALSPQDARQYITGVARTGSRQLNRSPISEVESTTERARTIDDAESSSTIFRSAESTNIAESSPSFSANSAISANTSEMDHFERILFESRVYQKSSKYKSPLFYSNATWSELHRSGASIFSYRPRSSNYRPRSSNMAVASIRTRAPTAILTKDQYRLQDAFIEATRKRDIKAISIFLEYGADVNAVDRKTYESFLDQDRLLHSAAERSHVDVVRALLVHGANANIVNWESNTPLHIAAQYGTPDMVQLLLQYGADTELVDNKDRTALFYAIWAEKPENVKALLQAGADSRRRNKWSRTPLHWAVWAELEIVKILIHHGVDMEATDNDGRTALFYTIGAGKLEHMKALLQAGADLGRKNKWGKTPLHCAAALAELEMVKILIHHGADIECIDNEGETALFSAIRGGKLENVEALLQAGSDWGRGNNMGQTPLEIAVMRDFMPIAEMLQSYESE